MAEKKDKAQGGEGEESKSPKTQKKREEKISRWTLELCMKYAKRFDSVDAWAQGAPSCFKAATARGFVAKCSSHMSGKTKTVATPKTKTAAPAKKKTGKKTA
jgi:hypothetical protein